MVMVLVIRNISEGRVFFGSYPFCDWKGKQTKGKAPLNETNSTLKHL